MMDDLISRQAAIDALKNRWKKTRNYEGIGDDIAEECELYLKQVPSAQSGQRNARVFQGIIVEYPSISAYPEYEGKPYFSIKYTENGQGFIGYGTYKPEVLSEYLKEYFMPSAQPVVISKSENTTECEDAVSREAVLNEIHRYMEERDYTIGLLDDNVCGLPSVTPKQLGWTYIEEALPKTIINKHTHDYQGYNCLCDFGDNGFDVRTYKFGNGHFWNGGGNVDKYVTAWQPLPEIPDALKQKPWEGGQDG